MEDDGSQQENARERRTKKQRQKQENYKKERERRGSARKEKKRQKKKKGEGTGKLEMLCQRLTRYKHQLLSTVKELLQAQEEKTTLQGTGHF